MGGMSDILFIRHGATDLAGTFCGHSDPPLNERGRQQVVGLVEELRGETIEAVYSSDLLRARETAGALATAKVASLHSLPGLREISFGDWEGLSWSEVEAVNAQYAERWLVEYPGLSAPGGEAVGEFEARVLATIETLLQIEQRSVAVVSHAGVMRLVMRRLGGFTEDQCFARTKEYCSIVRLSRARGSDAAALAIEKPAPGASL
jgi:broad specificity phosphatase PhoE